ncbi:hypothetical protein SAMN04487894_13615, partial [Niabella drilacis]
MEHRLMTGVFLCRHAIPLRTSRLILNARYARFPQRTPSGLSAIGSH